MLTQYGLSSHKGPPPVCDHLGLKFYVVALQENQLYKTISLVNYFYD